MKDHPTPGGTATAAIPMLAAHSVTKRFGGAVAVSAVSLAVQAGELAGLIGPNGAGKTTLFDILAGDQAPTSGRVSLRGRFVEAEPAHLRPSRGLARTFQIPRPFPAMTVLENVMLGRQCHIGERLWASWLTPGRVAHGEAVAQRQAMELLDFVALAPLARQPARILSGGQRKLLELARIMMAEPSIVLLDEPAAGVHPALLDVIAQRIEVLNSRGTTFLIVEHNTDLIDRLCDRVFVMNAGELLCEGTPRDVLRDPRVAQAYLGGAAA
jgi:branched-chain amino acid transport system ATP-binding protein